MPNRNSASGRAAASGRNAASGRKSNPSIPDRHWCLDFDGSNDYVKVPNDDTINLMNVYYRSYGIWFKADETTSQQVIYKEGGTSNGFSFYLEGDNLYYGFWGSQINNIWNSVAFTDTASWHYIQFTFDSVGGVQKMYLDGAEVGSSSETGYVPSHSGAISIGACNGSAKYHDGDSSADYYFNGQIDEVRIYNTALSVAEVLRHYRSDFSQDPSADLVACWHFDGITGDRLFDSSGSSNHGTISGATHKLCDRLDVGLVAHWKLGRGTQITSTELITNGTMEADANWSDYGTPATNERSSTQKYSGSYSRKFIPDAANEGIQGDVFTTTDGGSYQVIFYIYPDDGTTASIKIREGDDSGDAYTNDITGLTENAWNKVVFEYKETINGGGAGAYIVIHSGASTSGAWYVDEVSIQALEQADLTLNGNDITVFGAIYTTDNQGNEDSAMSFNGTTDYIAIQNLHYDTAGQIPEITVSAWVKIPAGGGNWSIVDFDRSDYYTCAAGIPSGSTNGAGDYVGWHTTNSSGGIDDMWSTGTVRDDAWHFIAWVYDGNEVNDKKIYIDGALDAEKDAETTGVNLGKGSTRYGFLGDGSEATAFNGGRNNIWYEGSISDVRIYNRALSIDEIKQLYYHKLNN